ncbi:MAG: zinc-binding dehydrogenase [Actinomycetota bacterium]|nr:zinc-binding dehydrogenase [Actinomycetota bacterium]
MSADLPIHDLDPAAGANVGYLTRPGAPPRLVEQPAPEPADDEVVVRTRAVALNHADLAGADDGRVAGYELSGEVVAVGADVDPTLVGRRVMGTTPGAFARFATAHRRHVIAIPDEVSFEDAAALPTALLTEHGALTTAGVGPGDTVLLTAATSGIGLIGVQLAKLAGCANVIATTRSEERRALLESVGATTVVVADGDDLADRVLDATGGRGVDVVLDHIGGAMVATCVAATRVGGVVVSVGRLAGEEGTVDLMTLAKREVLLRSVSYGFTPPETIGRLLDGLGPEIIPAVVDGRVRAVVDRVLPFDRADEAFEHLRSGRPDGKVVLTGP